MSNPKELITDFDVEEFFNSISPMYKDAILAKILNYISSQGMGPEQIEQLTINLADSSIETECPLCGDKISIHIAVT